MKKNRTLSCIRGRRQSGSFARHALIASLLLPLLVSAARANQVASDDLTSFNLEDLMQIEVSSVARKQQKMADTAAAAYVISQEDIRRSGATSIPEALRLAPGLNVARIDSSHWAISARGFNGHYANKLLVLMDGRTIYTPMFSGVFWDIQDTFIEDIERIEVIRGPGAAMWGANAVNGVINIITKSAKNTQGNLLVAGAGNFERGFAGFRHGGQLDEDAHYRVYGKGLERDATNDGAGRRQNDDWRAFRTGFRVDRKLPGSDKLTVQGDVYRLRVGETVNSYAILTPPYSNSYAADDGAQGANLLARWEGRFSDQSEFTLQAYYDRAQFSAPKLSDRQNTFDLDFQHRLASSLLHDVMWGANLRYIQSKAGNTADISFNPASRSYRNVSAFVQDDIALMPERLRLTMGAKFEVPHFGGAELQPNARLLWTPDGNNSIWTAVSRASRTPSRGEIESRIALGVIPPFTSSNPTPFPMQLETLPDPNLKAERLTAYEIGYRSQWSSRFSLDIAAFTNRYQGLSQWKLGTPTPDALPIPSALILPFAYVNAGTTTRTRGIEMVADWRVLDWLRLEGSYTYLKMRTPPPDGVNTDYSAKSPDNQFALRCLMDLDSRTQLDLWLRRVGSLGAQTRDVPAYTALDVRFGYAVSKTLDLSLVGQNLLDRRHAEFVDSASRPLVYFARGIFAKATWRF